MLFRFRKCIVFIGFVVKFILDCMIMMAAETPTATSIGYINPLAKAKDMRNAMLDAVNDGFDFMASYFTHPWCSQNFSRNNYPASPNDLGLIGTPDMTFKGTEWNKMIVGMVSPWLDVDSDDVGFRKLSEKVLHDELLFAKHVGLPAVMVTIRGRKSSNLARILNQHMAKLPNYQVNADEANANYFGNGFFSPFFSNVSGANRQVWARVPTATVGVDVCFGNPTGSSSSKSAAAVMNGKVGPSDDVIFAEPTPVFAGMAVSGAMTVFNADGIAILEDDTWQWWDNLRSAFTERRKLAAVLEFTRGRDLGHLAQMRWLGEPIKGFIMNTDVFVPNANGYPVLTKATQSFAIQLMVQLGAQCMLEGVSRLEDRPLLFYQRYVQRLFKQTKRLDAYGEVAKGYEDFLQYPLQPLADNLECATYEVFELDPVKYTQYRAAILRAMEDKLEAGQNDLIVAVLGCGRGPLVLAALDAALTAGIRIKQVYAVEKNPWTNASLKALKEKPDWAKHNIPIEIVCADMREWTPAERVDIIVSELLGSFGDNELSPECLDNALPRIAKDNAVCIPESYVSYLAPLHSPKLWTLIDTTDDDGDKRWGQSYVVRVHNRYQIATAKPVFSFTHKSPFETKDQSRFVSLTFDSPQTCYVHGFVGYFETVLYKDVKLSTVPDSHSPGMFSWFPILFPLKIPAKVKRGDEIQVQFWRLTDQTKVWYEWHLSAPTVSEIHNTNGEGQAMHLNGNRT